MCVCGAFNAYVCIMYINECICMYDVCMYEVCMYDIYYFISVLPYFFLYSEE